jgi:hypothetical protein
MRDGDTTNEEIARMIEATGDYDGFNARLQRSYLSEALSTDREPLAYWLLEKGADPNKPGFNPLYQALVVRDIETARRLLAAGADWSRPFTPSSRDTSVREKIEKEFPDLVRDLDTQADR